MEQQQLHKLEQEKRENELALCSRRLSRAVQKFMLECYLEAVPPEQFAAFWCAASCGAGSNNPIIDRSKTSRCLREPERARLAKMDPYALGRMDNSRFAKILHAGIGLKPEDALRRALLEQADLAAMFKFNTVLDPGAAELAQAGVQQPFTLYPLLQKCFPGLGGISRKDWMDRNRKAVRQRNNWEGHTDASTYKNSKGEVISAGEWCRQADSYLDVVKLLKTPQNTAAYEKIDRVLEQAARLDKYRLTPLEEFTAHCPYPVEMIGNILNGRYHEACADGMLYAIKEEALEHLRRYAAQEEDKKNYQNILAELERLVKQGQRNEPGTAAPQEQDPRVLLKTQPETRRALLKTQLAGLPGIDRLRRYEGGAMASEPLRELAATHCFLLDVSVLASPDGRRFLNEILCPLIEQGGRRLPEALLVEATALYHLMQGMQRYKSLDAALANLPRTPAFEQERQRLLNERQALHSAQSGYLFVRDRLGLSPAGIPAPLSTDEDSALEFLQAHPFQRVCVLTCGATGLPRKLTREQTPFAAVARVRSANGIPQLSIFSQFLPLPQNTPDEPLLACLTDSFFEKLSRQAEKRPAPLKRPGPAAPVPAQEEAAPAPVSAPKAAASAPNPAPKGTGPAPISNDIPPAQESAASVPENLPKDAVPGAGPQNAGMPQTTRSTPRAFAADPPLRLPDRTLLPLTRPAREGDRLHTETGASVTLGGFLLEDGEEARGGEGALYHTNAEGQVAKLYFADHLTAGRRDKLAAMLRAAPGLHGLCWPAHLLYNQQDEFVGYLMPQAPESAMPFSKSVLKIGSPSQYQKFMSGWDRRDLVQVARSTAALAAGLHRKNILMGDVNAGNFMADLKDSRKVYLVDTDSFQLDGYPCPVGVEEFTHPGTAARLGVKGALQFGTFLRTREEEEYALALLLFEILFLGANPFVSKSEVNYLDAMRAKAFPYANTGEEWTVPDGDTWMIWKNLPRKVSDAFTRTFADWNTASAEEWVRLMDSYLYSIEQRGFSRELAPEKYHEFNPDDPTYVDLVCQSCGREFNLHKVRAAKLKRYQQPALCRGCSSFLKLHQNEPYPDFFTCTKCKKTYNGTVKDALYLSIGIQKPLCSECANPSVSCAGCGSSFRLPLERLEELQQKKIPPVCDKCRGSSQVTCEACEEEFEERNWRIAKAEREGRRLLCPDCRKDETVSCEACGDTFRQAHWRTEKNEQEQWPNLCQNCRSSNTLRARCGSCGQPTELPRKVFAGKYHAGEKILCRSCYQKSRF